MRSSSFLVLSIMVHAGAVTAIALAPQRTFNISEPKLVKEDLEVAVANPTATAVAPKATIANLPEPVAAEPATIPEAKPTTPPKPKASVAALLKRKTTPKKIISVDATPEPATAPTAAAAPVAESSTEPKATADASEPVATETAQPEETPELKPIKETVGASPVEAAEEEASGEEEAPAATHSSNKAGDTKQEAVSYLGLKQLAGNKPPSYPEEARQDNRQGTTELIYRVTKDGSVTDVSIAKSSGHADLDNAAQKAIRSFKFVPGQEGWARHPVTFSLKGPDKSQQAEIE